MSEYLDYTGLSKYDEQIKSYVNSVSGNSTGVRIVSLNSAPTSSTLTYQIDSTTYSFKIGDEVVVKDTTNGTESSDQYVIYKLYNIKNNTAYWDLDGANTTVLKASQKGVANGVASLDSSGKVPSQLLPSYVDDVIEGYLYEGSFYEDSTHETSITGESGKIYTDLSTNKTYRWGGSAYSQIKGDLVIGTATGNAADGKVVNDHINDTIVHVTAAERTAWNAKGSYSIPDGGIPATDLAQTVQTSLGKADTALQSHQDISGKADKSATVSTISYDTTNKKITKTINGTTTDVVTASKIVTDGGGITSHQDISGKADKTATVSTISYDTTNKKITKTINGSITDVVTAAKIVTDGGGITSHLDISGKADKATTLAGYGITDAKIASGVITLGGNTITPLTSHQDISGKADKASITAGTYKSVTVNAQGIVTGGSNPTTLSGYGITDAKIANGVITLGSNSITPLTSHQDISGKANKASITAGTAGTSSATSGSTLAVPYVTVNAQGIVTGYDTHTHTISGFLTSHQDISGKLDKSGGTMTGTLTTKSQGRTVNTQSTSGAVSINAANGDLHVITLNGAVSGVTISNATAGQEVHVIFYSASEYTVAIVNSATYVCPAAADLSLTVKAGGYCEVGFLYDGSKFFVRGV